MKSYPLALCAGFLLIGLATHSRAQVLVNCDFGAGYSTTGGTGGGGDLTGQSGTDDVGFSNAFQPTSATQGSAPTQTVVAGGLTYSNGSVFINGGSQSVQVASTYAFSISQALVRGITPSLSGQTFYMRAVISGTSADDLLLNLNGSGVGSLDQSAGIGAIDSTNTGATAAGQLSQFYNNGGGGFQDARADSGVALPTGNDLLVAEFVFTAGEYRTVNFFLNPTTLTQGTPTATYTIPAGSDGATSLGDTLTFTSTNNQTTYDLDSIAIGENYSDVVTGVPEPSTWVMVGMAALFGAVQSLRRRRCA